MQELNEREQEIIDLLRQHPERAELVKQILRQYMQIPETASELTEASE